MAYSRQQVYLITEYLLLFFGIPLCIIFFSDIIHPSVILVPLLILIFILLRFRTSFRFAELTYLNISRQKWVLHLGIIFFCGVFIAMVLILYKPDALFNLPKGNPKLWLILFIYYPLFSALPQEIIYRTFIFKRYQRLIPHSEYFVALSGISFSFAHILYFHPLSIILTLVMGFYLAHLYSKTRSVLFTSILHGLLGNLAFTIGLGEYFWLDILEHLNF